MVLRGLLVAAGRAFRQALEEEKILNLLVKRISYSSLADQSVFSVELLWSLPTL